MVAYLFYTLIFSQSMIVFFTENNSIAQIDDSFPESDIIGTP